MDNTGIRYKVDYGPDPARKGFLYSAFPTNRDVNSKHWDAKLAFWTEEIRKSALSIEDLCVDLNKLQERFYDGSYPLGIPVVLNEMIQIGAIVPADQYLCCFQNSWLGWAYQVTSASASWLWQNVFGKEESPKEYVILDVVKDKAEQLLKEHSQRSHCPRTDLVIPFGVLLTYKIDGKPLDEKTATLVIGYLKQQRKVQAFVDENGQKIVKFPAKGKITADSITKDDFHILRLKQAIAKLHLEIKRHVADINRLRAQAKEFMKNDKERAKRSLREMKCISSTVKSKEDQLFLLNDQLKKIQEIDSQKMMVEALNSSSSLINNVFKSEDISLAKVESAIEKSEEALENFKEVDDALHNGLKHLEDTEGIDMSELENELMNLVLPEVPSEIDEDKVPVETVEDVDNSERVKPSSVQRPRKALIAS